MFKPVSRTLTVRDEPRRWEATLKRKRETQHGLNGITRALASFLLLAALLTPGMLRAADANDLGSEGATAAVQADDGGTAWWSFFGDKAPWRGSSLTYRNEVSALTFDKGAELTYNPYHAMSLMFGGRWWFGDTFFASLGMSLAQELTNADSTTKRGEVWFGDLSIGGGASRFYTIPVVGIAFSADAKILAPTSKVSQARTTIMNLRGGLTMSRSFEVLSGLSLRYRIEGGRGLYSYTTSELEAPRISGCAGTATDCDRFLNTGLRNPKWRLVNSFGLGMEFLPWLGASTSYTLLHYWLFPSADDERADFVPQEPTDMRYIVAYDVEVHVSPIDAFTISVGASTANAQQMPDSSYRQALFNRYTTVFADLTLNIDGFVDLVSGKSSKSNSAAQAPSQGKEN